VVEVMDNMPRDSTASARWFRTAAVFSLVVGLAGWLAPRLRMPLRFDLMLWWSLPLAGLWLVMIAVCALRFRKRALWLLFGAPLALYWPIWLVFNRIPDCHWLRNCA
jgi:hypothetical protein